MVEFLNCAMHVVIYACYIKKWNGEDSTQPSIDEQIQSCCEFAERNNYYVERVYIEETYNNSYRGRPIYYQMLGERIDTRFQGILIYSSDRINKNSFQFMFNEVNLKEWGISVFTTKNNK